MAKKEEKVVKEKNKENKVKKHFFKDFKAELKKVIWPTPKQLVNNTVAVVIIVAIVGAIVFALDSALKKLQEYIVIPAQNAVVEKFGEDEEEASKENNEAEGTTSENTTADGNTATDGENSTESNQ